MPITYPAGAGINPWEQTNPAYRVTYPAGAGINLESNSSFPIPAYLPRRRGDKPIPDGKSVTVHLPTPQTRG